ncbi:hypothetical protein PSPO01_10224 [Paraphaeosphaeria sporulosa]
MAPRRFVPPVQVQSRPRFTHWGETKHATPRPMIPIDSIAVAFHGLVSFGHSRHGMCSGTPTRQRSNPSFLVFVSKSHRRSDEVQTQRQQTFFLDTRTS